MPFFYSILIHLVILALIFGIAYRPDRRPIREVNYWVVGLVPALREEPRGPKTPLPEDLSLIPAIHPSVPELFQQTFQEKETYQEDPLPQPIEIAQKTDNPTQNLSLETQHFLPSDEIKKIESVAPVLPEAKSNQLQTGQFLFRTKIGDPMAVIKMKYYQKNIREQAAGILRDSIPASVRTTLQGQEARVEVSYNQGGEVEKVLISSDISGTFAELIKDLDWKSLSSPFKFGLPFTTVTILIHGKSNGLYDISFSFI